MKRFLDVLLATLGLAIMAPLLLIAMLAIWLQDRHSPFYIAPRVGRDGRLFNMVKLRTMCVDAQKTGVDSTAAGDPRITVTGSVIRRYKLDEFTQLWNVLRGDMSLVGPRPNVRRETDLYTAVERKLLTVKPGITDFSSIVFADEGDILSTAQNPDVAYNQLIRPWKSRLGLLYVERSSLRLDLWLILLTMIALFSRSWALRGVAAVLARSGAPEDLIRIAQRRERLAPAPPPGADTIVTSR